MEVINSIVLYIKFIFESIFYSVFFLIKNIGNKEIYKNFKDKEILSLSRENGKKGLFVKVSKNLKTSTYIDFLFIFILLFLSSIYFLFSLNDYLIGNVSYKDIDKLSIIISLFMFSLSIGMKSGSSYRVNSSKNQSNSIGDKYAIFFFIGGIQIQILAFFVSLFIGSKDLGLFIL